MKVALLCDGQVGEAVKEFLEQQAHTEVKCCSPKEWEAERDEFGYRCAPAWLRKFSPEWLVLAWWPYIVGKEVLICSRHSVNIHNSFLPWCRGKHPNFWAIVEGVPYGVSLHEVTEKIDAGKCYVQQTIPVTWEDTGETLHKKSQDLAVDLFKRSRSPIVNGVLTPGKAKDHGSFHLAEEIEEASNIPLGVTTGRELLNLIRARQAYGFSAWFTDAGKRYNVTLNITPKS